MGRVVSFGSVNVDHVRYCEAEWIAAQSERYAWFPAAGETVAVEEVPPEFTAAFDRTFLGGKGANQAVAAAVAGADSTLLGAVGDDADEYAVLETLGDRGVDVSSVESVTGPTGAAFVAVDEAGENHIAILAGANGEVDAAVARRHVDALSDADCVLFQNELPAGAVVAALDVLADDGDSDAEDSGPIVAFDPAPAAGAERVLAHDRVDVVTPNDGEYEQLRDAVAAFDGVVVRTRGADGVTVESREGGGLRTGPLREWDGEAFTVEPPAVEPVDTTGAGDVFDGYLATALVDGRTLRDAVDVATVAAGLSTTTEGVQTAVPDPEAVCARRR